MYIRQLGWQKRWVVHSLTGQGKQIISNTLSPIKIKLYSLKTDLCDRERERKRDIFHCYLGKCAVRVLIYPTVQFFSEFHSQMFFQKL